MHVYVLCTTNAAIHFGVECKLKTRQVQAHGLAWLHGPDQQINRACSTRCVLLRGRAAPAQQTRQAQGGILDYNLPHDILF